jgi:ABC-type transporter Mla MlaB component
MLRISRSKSITLATVHLEGKLLEPWVSEVRTMIASLRADESVRLNLEHLSFADRNGIALLQELRRGGVELSGCSALIAGLLAAHPAAAGTKRSHGAQ